MTSKRDIVRVAEVLSSFYSRNALSHMPGVSLDIIGIYIFLLSIEEEV